MKKMLLLCSMLIAGLFLISCTSGAENYEDNWEEHWMAVQLRDCILPLSLSPGVFAGTDSGKLHGDVSVIVTVSFGNVITAIEITKGNEIAQYANPTFEQLISDIISAQRPSADAYYGATKPSRTFLNATWDALAKSIAAGPGDG